MRRGSVALVLVIVTGLRIGSASADDKAACFGAAEQGQTLRGTGKLLAAREAFVLCARPACPTLVQKDCVGWLSEVEKGLPTVVLTAKAATGADLVDITVRVDGHPFASRLDGRAVAIDPGSHAFHFVAEDGATLDRTVVIVEGQKDQRIDVSFASFAPASSVDVPGVGTDNGRSRRVAGIVVAAGGVLGVALGGIFGGLGFSSWSSVTSMCPSHHGCSPAAVSDYNSAVTLSTASDVAFVAGGVLLAAGAALYFTAPKAKGTQVGVVAGPGSVGLSGSF